jgi:hypothetical protein
MEDGGRYKGRGGILATRNQLQIQKQTDLLELAMMGNNPHGFFI